MIHNTITSDLVLPELADIPLTIVQDPFALPMALFGASKDLAIVSVSIWIRLIYRLRDEIVCRICNLLDEDGSSHVPLVEDKRRAINF